MSGFKINKDGVPLLSANDIEKKAEEVLEFFNPEILHASSETPLLSFVEETVRRFDFTYGFSQDLGSNLLGHKILGKFQFR